MGSFGNGNHRNGNLRFGWLVRKGIGFSRFFGVILLGLGLTHQVTAQIPVYSPPVERVRSVLLQVTDTPTERESKLRKAIEGLQSNRERREAFLLPDWRDHHSDNASSSADQKLRMELGQFLGREYRGILQSQDQDRIRLLLEKMPDFSRPGDESEAVNQFLKDLRIEVSQLARKSSTEIRRSALIALAKTHAEAELMLPLLAQLSKDAQPEVRLAAAEGLDTLIKMQMPANFAKTGNQPLHFRREAISQQIARLIPVAVQLLNDPQSKIRIMGSESLLDSAMLFRSLISEPGQTLAGVDPAEIRRMVSSEWTELEPLVQAWSKHLAALGKGLVDRNPQVRLNSQKTLDELTGIRVKRLKHSEAVGLELPDSFAQPIRGVIPTVVEALRDPDIRVKRAAIDVLESMGPLAIQSAPTLQASLEDPDPFVRWASLRALAAMGPEVLKQNREKIQFLAKDPDPDVRKTAESCLRRFVN